MKLFPILKSVHDMTEEVKNLLKEEMVAAPAAWAISSTCLEVAKDVNNSLALNRENLFSTH